MIPLFSLASKMLEKGVMQGRGQRRPEVKEPVWMDFGSVSLPSSRATPETDSSRPAHELHFPHVRTLSPFLGKLDALLSGFLASDLYRQAGDESRNEHAREHDRDDRRDNDHRFGDHRLEGRGRQGQGYLASCLRSGISGRARQAD